MKIPILLNAYGGSSLPSPGVTRLELSLRGKRHNVLFAVVPGNHTPLLSRKASESLGLVKRVYALQTRAPTNILDDYVDVFSGVGEFQKPYHIEVDPNVPPQIQPSRKVPFARYDKLKTTLDDLQARGIIADVDKPTDWVSNLVIVEKKNGSLRLCLDPKPLNTAIRRERYTIPTPSDVQSQLSGKHIFTILDDKDDIGKFVSQRVVLFVYVQHPMG